MALWTAWLAAVTQLRNASSNRRNFMWFVVVLAGMRIRRDLLGVTSIVRVLGLNENCYHPLLRFFHSSAMNLQKLTELWVSLTLKLFKKVIVNERYLIIGDGIKIAKSGKKMPAVKGLHQVSSSNTKPEFIMGHSCQAIALLAQGRGTHFAVPLASRIHEGLVHSDIPKQTLSEKMIALLKSLKLDRSFYLVLDAFYSNRKIIKGILGMLEHLVVRIRNNAVAYYPAPRPEKPSRGRPKIYGEKVKLGTIFQKLNFFIAAKSPIYGQKNVEILYYSLDLIWKPRGGLVRLVFVIDPQHGKFILMSTDLTLDPLDVVRIYGFRFKIEVSFKSALRILGAYSYRFWSKLMNLNRRGSGDQNLDEKSENYCKAIFKKLLAYELYIQTGLIAQGLLQYLSATFPKTVWECFGSWMRTIRDDISPSEQVTSNALRHSLPEFLKDSSDDSNFKKFMKQKIDVNRSDGIKFAS